MNRLLKEILLVIVAIVVGILLENTSDLEPAARGMLFVVLLLFSFGGIWLIERRHKAKTKRQTNSLQSMTSSRARGGRGGGGHATGRNSTVVGGRGGRGGGMGAGRGGDGGGGNATGEGSTVIGGDGGDAGRSDGRGGKGGASPVKKMSPEELKSWGLTGNEGYGQGGSGPNSHEYDRSLQVLSQLSVQYSSEYPGARLMPMPGVLMPPLEWVNSKLEEMSESFRVELIDRNTDFILRQND